MDTCFIHSNISSCISSVQYQNKRKWDLLESLRSASCEIVKLAVSNNRPTTDGKSLGLAKPLRVKMQDRRSPSGSHLFFQIGLRPIVPADYKIVDPFGIAPSGYTGASFIRKVWVGAVGTNFAARTIPPTHPLLEHCAGKPPNAVQSSAKNMKRESFSQCFLPPYNLRLHVSDGHMLHSLQYIFLHIISPVTR